MGLAERVLSPSEPAVEQRELQPWGDWSPAAPVHAGVRVNQSTALNLLTVYGATALISDTIANLPIDVYRRAGDGSKVEVAPPRWLETPNERDDIVDLTVQFLVSLLLDGSAFVTYSVDRSFMVSELAVLDPTRVVLREEDGRAVPYFDGQRFGGPLVHVKGITQPGQVRGLSPVEAARQGIGLGLAAQEFGGRFFGNGQHMSGVIEMEGEPDREKARIVKEMWMRDHSGLARAWEPGILFNAKWTPISVTPEQAQFLDTRKFTAAEIAAQMFLVDPTLLGIPVDGKSLTYANLEQRGIHLVTFTLLRWIRRFERMVDRLLPKARFVKLNVDGLMRADLKTRYESYQIGLNAGFLMESEVRDREDLPPMGDADSTASPETLARLIQQIYLGVDTVVTWDEAREILNRAGANLDIDVASPMTEQNARRVLDFVRDEDGRAVGLEVVK